MSSSYKSQFLKTLFAIFNKFTILFTFEIEQLKYLTLNDPCISENCIEIKIKLHLYFHFFVVPQRPS